MPKPVIICVDDEEVILDSLKVQLKKEFGDRFSFETAESGDEALEIIEELSEDGIDVVVILSDWLMPEKKGDEFLIDAHEKNPKAVKIMLTGQADPEGVERAKEQANLHACLSKPWTKEKLITTIQAGLETL